MLQVSATRVPEPLTLGADEEQNGLVMAVPEVVMFGGLVTVPGYVSGDKPSSVACAGIESRQPDGRWEMRV